MSNKPKRFIQYVTLLIAFFCSAYYMNKATDQFFIENPATGLVSGLHGEVIDRVQHKHSVTLETNFQYQVTFSTGVKRTFKTSDPFYFKDLAIGDRLTFKEPSFHDYREYGYTTPWWTSAGMWFLFWLCPILGIIIVLVCILIDLIPWKRLNEWVESD